jgi:uncharacterized protein YecT (DUF1311 family)
MQIFLVISFLIFTNVALADQEQQGLEVLCDNKSNFSIAGYDLENGEPVEQQKPGSSIYSDYDKHHVRCALGKNVVEVDFQVSTPAPRGECGSSPGGEIGIKVNGASILRNGIRINQGCFDTIGSVSVENYYSRNAWGCTSESPKCRDGYILKICGSYTKSDKYLHNLKYNGCVSVMDEQLRQIQPALKLSWTPLDDLLKFLVAPQVSPQQSVDSSSTPSYDCAKVSSVPEKLICSNKQLGEADMRLSGAYADYLKKVPDKGAAKNQQVFWLKHVRDACTTAECMLNAYSVRIAELTKQ